jgi:single-stranded-DNA-specific exonuclease
MAAGITVEREKLGALRAFFEEQAAADVFRLQDEEALHIDAALAAEGATLDLLDALEKAGPFGAGHVAPVFALPRHRLADARLVGTNHIRVELQSESGGRVQAIAFRAVDTALGDFLFKNRGKTVHVAGSLSGNYWNGNKTVQFRIIDAALA